MGRHETVDVAPSLEHPHDRGAEAERDVEVHMSDDITHPPTDRQRGRVPVAWIELLNRREQ